MQIEKYIMSKPDQDSLQQKAAFHRHLACRTLVSKGMPPSGSGPARSRSTLGFEAHICHGCRHSMVWQSSGSEYVLAPPSKIILRLVSLQ